MPTALGIHSAPPPPPPVKNLIACALLLCASLAHAELHKGQLSFSYTSGSGEISFPDGSRLDADETSTNITGQYFVSDQLELALGLGDGEVDLQGIKVDAETTVLGFAYHTSRVDYELGEGDGWAIHARRSSVELLGEDVNSTNVGATYTEGLGKGFSLNVGLQTDVEDIGKSYSAAIGFIQCFGNRLCLEGSAGYSSTEGDASSSTSTGLSIGLGVLF